MGYGLRDLLPGVGQVQELGHVSHTDPHGAGGTVAAVHTMPLPMDPGKGGQCGGIVSCRLISLTVGGAALQLRHGVGTRQYHGYCRPGQSVGDALIDSQRHAGGGKLRVQQIASGEGFHHRDADAQPLAGLIQPLPVGIHVGQIGGVRFIGPELLHVLVGGLEVIAGVHGEHQYLDTALGDGPLRHQGVVAGQADVADATGDLQLSGIVQDAVSDDGFPVAHGVAVMDHTHVQIVGVQELHHLLETGLDLIQVSRAKILPVFPDGADVGLDEEFFPPALQRPAHRRTHLRIGGIEVKVVDPQFLGPVKEPGGHCVSILGEPLTAQSDDAGPEAGVAQLPVFHIVICLSYDLSGFTSALPAPPGIPGLRLHSRRRTGHWRPVPPLSARGAPGRGSRRPESRRGSRCSGSPKPRRR